MKNYSLMLLPYRLCLTFLLLLPLSKNNFYLFATSSKNTNQSLIIQKQEEIIKLYEKKRYANAIEAIELVLPLLRNRTDRSKYELYQAYCNFYQKKYLISANQFHLLVKQYPTSSHVEEALFMEGYSLSSEDVDIQLDQTTPYNAKHCLEHYLALYPTGAYVDKASDALQHLEKRFMEKSFYAAELYARLGYYNAAIIAIKNFQQTYQETHLNEKVLRLLIKCYQKLALKASDEEKKEEMHLSSKECTKQLAEYLNDKKVSLSKINRKRFK